MKLPRIAIKNAQFTFTMVLLMVLVGIVSYFQMPRSEDPQFDISIVLIEVIYPGASPHDIETLVVNALEQEFADIEGIKKIESQIKNDGARIQVFFYYGSDPHDAYNEIKQAVASVEPTLPNGVEEVLVLKATPTSVAIIQLALWSQPTDYKLMEFYGKQLEKRLEAINSVKKADLWGVPQQVVAVDLNLDLLSHYGIDVNTITQVLQQRAINTTPGYVDATTRRFNVKASGNFQQLEQLRETVVYTNEQMVLRLKDIAQVVFSSAKPSYLTYLKEKPVVFLTVEQRNNSNIFTLTEQIEEVIKRFKQQLPEGVNTQVIFKQTDSVAKRVNGFFDNLWQGLLLVGLMAIVFLGFREALVVIVVIPLSFLIAIGWLDFIGFGLQQMSIVGLIIALGLLVDNAIVVTESIHRQKQGTSDLANAAAVGTSKVGWAITSGTTTTMFAFLPMLMIASDTGDFLRSMPVTVILVLFASLLLALTFTPLMASKLFTKKPSRMKTLQTVVNKFAANSYSRLLAKLFTVRLTVIFLSLVALIVMGTLFTKVGLSLFPKAEKPMLMINVTAPANASLSYTDQVMQDIAQTLHQNDLVSQVAINVGSANPRMYYNEIPKRGVSSYGQALVILKEFDEAKMADLVQS
jgi:multidrug efflux pump subunit AcrB